MTLAVTPLFDTGQEVRIKYKCLGTMKESALPRCKKKQKQKKKNGTDDKFDKIESLIFSFCLSVAERTTV